MKKKLISGLVFSSLIGAAQADKPNVLLIFTDDQRYTGTGMGGGQLKTPHIDSLAENGVSFSNAYLMGSLTSATCVPSRAMLHSGRGVFDISDIGENIPGRHITIGETFKKAGYRSHIVGKWHNDTPSLLRSFDDGDNVIGRGLYLYDHFRTAMWDFGEGFSKDETAYVLVYDTKGNVVRRKVEPTDTRGATRTEKDGPHCSEVFADSAINFMNEYDRNSGQPFFMYLAFHTPHDPRQAPEIYRDMYPVEDIKLPPTYLPEHPFDNGHLKVRDERLAAFPRSAQEVKQHLSDYYAVITHMDNQIGRVVEGLKKSGLYDNTLIVFASDSGLAVGNHGLMGKQNIYDEDGLHVPFILSGGAIKNRGRVVDALCYVHDIYPTVCDIAGVDVPHSVTAKSMAPVLRNEAKAVRGHTYHAYRHHQRAFRKNGFKLIEYVKAPDKWLGKEIVAGSRTTQLFKVSDDLWEENNLSSLPEYQALIADMRKEMREAAQKHNDTGSHSALLFDFWDYFE